MGNEIFELIWPFGDFTSRAQVASYPESVTFMPTTAAHRQQSMLFHNLMKVCLVVRGSVWATEES